MVSYTGTTLVVLCVNNKCIYFSPYRLSSVFTLLTKTNRLKKKTVGQTDDKNSNNRCDISDYHIFVRSFVEARTWIVLLGVNDFNKNTLACLCCQFAANSNTPRTVVPSSSSLTHYSLPISAHHLWSIYIQYPPRLPPSHASSLTHPQPWRPLPALCPPHHTVSSLSLPPNHFLRRQHPRSSSIPLRLILILP